MATVLPMFPLGTVLLPGAHLDLHVFEERYRTLVRHCLAGTPEFGVVLIERGSEVGGGDARFTTGCVARITDALELPDGRSALRARGTTRVEVVEWLADDPYPRAVVAPRPDPPPGPGAADACARARAALERVLALASELGAARPPAVEPDADLAVAAWQLAAAAPVGPLDALALLRAPTVDDRLALLATLLDDLARVLASRLGGI